MRISELDFASKDDLKLVEELGELQNIRVFNNINIEKELTLWELRYDEDRPGVNFDSRAIELSLRVISFLKDCIERDKTIDFFTATAPNDGFAKLIISEGVVHFVILSNM